MSYRSINPQDGKLSRGLGGSVFTADIARGRRVANRIETGMVFVNHPSWTREDRNAGYGRELASLGTRELVRHTSVGQ
jgi:succinate-semialdehyde dehydrogenase/glutarate-semialdehyde dehydrogenase